MSIYQMLTPVNAQMFNHISGVELPICNLTIPRLGDNRHVVIICRSPKTPIEALCALLESLLSHISGQLTIAMVI